MSYELLNWVLLIKLNSVNEVIIGIKCVGLNYLKRCDWHYWAKEHDAGYDEGRRGNFWRRGPHGVEAGASWCDD